MERTFSKKLRDTFGPEMGETIREVMLAELVSNELRHMLSRYGDVPIPEEIREGAHDIVERVIGMCKEHEHG